MVSLGGTFDQFNLGLMVSLGGIHMVSSRWNSWSVRGGIRNQFRWNLCLVLGGIRGQFKVGFMFSLGGKCSL